MTRNENHYKTMKLLKPCPFCGGRAYPEDSHRSFVGGQSTRVSFIRCTQCNAKSPRFDNNRFGKKEALEMAVYNWNRRIYDNR